jgi:hypothetical protein
MRWGVCDPLFCNKRASEGGTEEDVNLRDINRAALSEFEVLHEKRGYRKQV